MAIRWDKFTLKAQEAVQRGNKLATEHGNPELVPLHLLGALLDQLSDEKRTLLILSELEQCTLREIAEVLGSNTNTIFSRLRAAKRDFDKVYTRWLTDNGDVP